MPSSTFLRLYANAMEREHAVIREAEMLWRAKIATTFPQAVRLAQSLRQAYSDFLDDIEQIVLRHQMRLRAPLRGCPFCGDPNCSGVELPASAILEKIFGIPPPLQPPPGTP